MFNAQSWGDRRDEGLTDFIRARKSVTLNLPGSASIASGVLFPGGWESLCQFVNLILHGRCW